MLEFVEPAAPEVGHSACPIVERREGVRACAIVGLSPLPAIEHQTSLLENAKVLRDGRLRDACLRRQRMHRLLTVTTQTFEEATSGRIGERRKQHIGSGRHLIHNPLVIGLSNNFRVMGLSTLMQLTRELVAAIGPDDLGRVGITDLVPDSIRTIGRA